MLKGKDEKKYFLEEIKIEADFVKFEAIELKMIMMMMVVNRKNKSRNSPNSKKCLLRHYRFY